MLSNGLLSALGITAPAPTSQGVLDVYCKGPEQMKPGVYGHGLITLLDAGLPRSLFTEWTWLIPQSSVPFAVTGFGDVFYLDAGGGVHFLEVQAAHVEFVDSSVVWAAYSGHVGTRFRFHVGT